MTFPFQWDTLVLTKGWHTLMFALHLAVEYQFRSLEHPW